MENDHEDLGVPKLKKLPYKCDFCEKAFDFYCRLSTHRRKHTGEKPFPCEICHKRFPSVTSRNIHRKLHLGNDDLERFQFQCDFCSKKFDFQCRLDVHRRIHTGEKPFSCEICDRKFTDRRALNVHKKLKHGIILNSILIKGFIYECESCDKTFMYRRQLVIHQQSHSVDKPFTCNYCLQHFARMESLEIHKRIHAGEKPYQCDVCYKRFAVEDELNVHGKAHESDEPTFSGKYLPKKKYKCEFCGKPFVYESRLKLHRTVHTRPYSCEICQRRFARRYVLRRHMKTHGIDWVPSSPKNKQVHLECEFCNEIFFSPHQLDIHKESHLTKTNDLNFNDAINSKETKHPVLIERLTASYNCESCSASFTSQDELQTHNELELCEELYSHDVSFLRTELNHNAEQQVFDNAMMEKITSTYDCEICEASFMSHAELNCHQQLHFSEKSFLNVAPCVSKTLDSNLEKKSPELNSVSVTEGITLTVEHEIQEQICTSDSKINCSQELSCIEKSFLDDECFLNKELDLTFEKKLVDTNKSVLIERVAPVYKCQICLMTFESQAEVDAHQEFHAKSLSVKETQPEFLESNKSVGIEASNRLYRCEICGKTFATNNDLITHEELHLNAICPTNYSLVSETDNQNFYVQNRLINSDSTIIIERIILPYQCKVCNEVFSSKNEMEGHQLMHIEKRVLDCDTLSPKTCDLDAIIGKESEKSNLGNNSCFVEPEVELFIHSLSDKTGVQSVKQMMNQEDNKPFSCELCNNKFVNKYEYNRHKRTHSDKKPFACDICPKKYWKRWNLKIHKMKHTNSVTHTYVNRNLTCMHQCEFCKKRFAWLNELNTHRRIHTGEKPFSCKVCHRRFSRKDQVDIHRKIHLGIKPFSCLTCHRQYSQKKYLILHRKILHPDEKSFESPIKKSHKYKCEYCAKVFYLQYQFKTHQRTHTGEKPYSCEICKKRFTRKWSLNLHQTLHVRTVVSADTESNKAIALNKPCFRKSIQVKEIFKCDSCEEDFVSEYLLKNHQQIHEHENWLFTCIVCLKPYASQTLLLLHSRIHMENPYFCVQCGKTYNLVSKLTKHVKIRHTEKAFACHLCNRSFEKQKYMNAHLKIHQLNRSFPCSYCNRIFPYESLVNSHKKTHLRPDNFKCEMCHKRVPSSSALSRHRNIHLSRKTYTCEHCQKTFVTKTAFELHVRSHIGRKPYPCNMCDKQYFYLAGLTYHMSRHTGHKPFHCPVCPMKFPERGGLNRHIKTHTGKKNHLAAKRDTKFFPGGVYSNTMKKT